MRLVLPSIERYRLNDTDRILTPALCVYPAMVEANLEATLRMAKGDAGRWRPHVKTTKIPAVMRQMMARGIAQFKCSTTLELKTLVELGAQDVLLAFPLVGANAERVKEIANAHAGKRISALVENANQIAAWQGSAVGLFLDVNPGMDRTGIPQHEADEIVKLGKLAGTQFRGLHYYDGQLSRGSLEERQEAAEQGYGQLVQLAGRLESEGIAVEELITSGTPVAAAGLAYAGFNKGSFVHRISPGTVVYNDTSSLQQLAGFGYVPAVVVLATVVSHPATGVATCDAGHKAVSVDSGVPNCAVLGWPHLVPQKPSEEHLPLHASDGGALPEVGEILYLVPRHVCPTVNNFDDALFVENGRIVSLERVSARGHESPLLLEH